MLCLNNDCVRYLMTIFFCQNFYDILYKYGLTLWYIIIATFGFEFVCSSKFKFFHLNLYIFFLFLILFLSLKHFYVNNFTTHILFLVWHYNNLRVYPNLLDLWNFYHITHNYLISCNFLYTFLCLWNFMFFLI